MSSLNMSVSSSELGSDFHRVIVDYKKECKYVSVLAKGVMKCWLCPQVEDEKRVSEIGTSTNPCRILENIISFR